MFQNSFNEVNTFKQYYYADESSNDLIIDRESPKLKRKRENAVENFDELFEVNKNKKKKQSSSVSRAHPEGGLAYITTNTDDGILSTHLIKIEIYDLKKLSKLPAKEHWKHADIKVKYYVDESHKYYEKTKNIVYQITQEVAKVESCKKMFFNVQ